MDPVKRHKMEAWLKFCLGEDFGGKRNTEDIKKAFYAGFEAASKVTEAFRKAEPEKT